MNRCVLMGRLTGAPELKYTPGNIAVTSFNIAVDRDYKTAQGERETDFLTIVAWRKTAEFICRYFERGKPIIIEGRLQTRSYEERETCKKRYVTEVVADAVKFVLTDRTRSQEGGAEGSAYTGYTNGDTRLTGGFDSLPNEEADLPF